MNKPFENMTNEQIIAKMNETGLDLIDPHYQEMKEFITQILNSNYFNSRKTMESQTELYKNHTGLLIESMIDNKYNNMFHRAFQIKELLDTKLCVGDNKYWYIDVENETMSDTPAEATRKLVEWFGEM